MQLSKKQLAIYRESGFLIIPDALSLSELARLRAVQARALHEDSPRRVMERHGRSVRGVHGQHTNFDVFARLVRHPRLLEPAMQIVRERVFVYQFKINMKAAFNGDQWPWHQDFIFWHLEDGMREPQFVNVAVPLDDQTEFNGPLLFLHGSHREGMISVAPAVGPVGDSNEPTWLKDFTADLKYALPHHVVRSLARRYPIVSAKAPAGSLVFFHANLVHGSSSNITPFDRCLILVTYSSVQTRFCAVCSPRPEFLASRDRTPLAVAESSVLLATTADTDGAAASIANDAGNVRATM